jgi:hypothetical protein
VRSRNKPENNQLSGGNGALALLCNTLPTGAILTVLILTFGPINRICCGSAHGDAGGSISQPLAMATLKCPDMTDAASLLYEPLNEYKPLWLDIGIVDGPVEYLRAAGLMLPLPF